MQLDIFDFIEKPKTLLERMCGKVHDPIFPCANCLCQYCANNVEELWDKVKPEEQKFPCFTCDECSAYGGGFVLKEQRKEECDKFALSDYGARKNREKFKILVCSNIPEEK